MQLPSFAGDTIDADDLHSDAKLMQLLSFAGILIIKCRFCLHNKHLSNALYVKKITNKSKKNAFLSQKMLAFYYFIYFKKVVIIVFFYDKRECYFKITNR